MTTTIIAKLPRSSPHRFRRDLIAALAGATLFASSAFVVNRIVDDEPQRVGAAATHASTLDITMMYGAFHSFTPPDVASAMVTPPAVVEPVGIEDFARELGFLLAE